jgi:hypothetical protein
MEDDEMVKRKYAYLILRNENAVEVSYHFRSDLREVMERIGYREGEYTLSGEWAEDKSSPWRHAKVPVRRLLGVGRLVKELKERDHGEHFYPIDVDRREFSVKVN